VVHQLEPETSKRVSTKTIKRLIKKSRYIGKRMRKAPVKSPAPQQYERGKDFIHRLQQREAAGECDLWYFDVPGFCLTPCLPYAWQPIGTVIEVPTSSHNRRLNVRGFLKRNNDLVPYLVEGKVDTSVIVECFEQFSQQIDKTTYVLLDNGPLHRSQEFIEQIPKWVKKGLIIKYLPPYSPELNLIEILWRFMKYYWLPFSAYASFQCLVAAIEEILTRVGAEYTIAFQAA
jgi:transposase